jgi:hypothetical protein
MRLSVVLALTTLVACSSKKKEEPDPVAPQPPGVGTLVRGDAGVTAIVTDVDPSGMHMDDDVGRSTSRCARHHRARRSPSMAP